jgi:predicted AAA+ superfamily ATPase
VAGPSWEGFAIENLISAAGERRVPYFYRTEDGAEMDLLFERAGKVEIAIEIKRSSSPSLSKGFHSARAVLKPAKTYLVHGGKESWPISEGIEAVPLLELMRRLARVNPLGESLPAVGLRRPAKDPESPA